MNVNPRKKAIIEARQRMRLRTDDPMCAYCGESNPARLMLYEGHHVTGRLRDPGLKFVICFNCQHELHDLRAPIAGVTFGKREGPIRARDAARLRALALSCEMQAEYLRRWADELEEGKDCGEARA